MHAKCLIYRVLATVIESKCLPYTGGSPRVRRAQAHTVAESAIRACQQVVAAAKGPKAQLQQQSSRHVHVFPGVDDALLPAAVALLFSTTQDAAH
jgi:hypothetical protein